jgi:putative ABC transport system substrate-binding protein
MRRRKFIALLGGAAAVWPLAAEAQQNERIRRIGVLMGWSDTDPQFRSWIDAFVAGLAQLGWADGRNVQINIRWARGDVGRMQTFAKELVELQPDIIVGGTTPATAALQRETRTIPIVFVVVADPVGAGFVAGLPHPGGNITGFLNAEAAIGGKWLETLKEIAPRITRVAIMYNPDTAPGGGAYFLGSFVAAARLLAVEPITTPVRSDADIEGAIASLGRMQGGLVIMTDSFMEFIGERSFRWQPAAKCRSLGPICVVSPGKAASSRMARTCRIFFVVQLPMSIAFCAERTRPTFRYRHRSSTR